MYLLILVSDTTIQAVLWTASQTQVSIVSQSSPEVYGSTEQAVIQTDQALQDLGKSSEGVNDVVFGLLPTWVDDQGIVAIRKPLLKSLTEKLGLRAAGFVVTSEALTRHLAESNPRLSALVIELSHQELFLSLMDQGKLISTKYVGRSEQIIADMAEALARVNAHLETELHLPSKMLVTSLELDESELVEQQQFLLNHDWVNSHPFQRPPTIEILPAQEILEAVVIQGGASVVGIKADYHKIPVSPTQGNQAVEQPIQDKPGLESPAVAVAKSKSDQSLASSFGVPVKIDQLPAQSELQTAVVAEKNGESETNNINDLPPSSIKDRMMSWFQQHQAFAMGGFIAGVLVLGVMTWIWLATGIQAELSLDLVTQLVSKEANITLDSSRNSSDVERLILAAQTMKKEVRGTKVSDATGVKLVGDKATGQVTLYNKTKALKKFEVGTELSKGDLVFTLDEEVEVASASVEKSTSSEKIEYGQAEATLTATKIGADSNLTKGTELQVASFDLGTYSAVVVETFTGGSSREVRVVSKGDRDKLFSELKQELVNEATHNIKSDLPDKHYLVPVDQVEIQQQDFDAEVGDEVRTLTLDLSLVAQALSYSSQDLQLLAQQILEADVPDNYTLAGSEPQILSSPDQVATQSGTVSLAVNLSAEAKPDLDHEQLKQDLAGKRLDEAEQTLVAKDMIKTAEIKLIPALAMKIWPRLPKDPAKIKIL